MPPESFLPDLPILLPAGSCVIRLDGDGTIHRMETAEARGYLTDKNPRVILCHRSWTATRLGMEAGALAGALDALELMAFIRPARFCLPTPRGLAAATGLKAADEGDDTGAVIALHRALDILLGEMAELNNGDNKNADARRNAIALARMMGAGGWGWAAPVLAALGDVPQETDAPPDPAEAIAMLSRLDEIPIPPPAPQPGSLPIATDAIALRLKHMLGHAAELRPGQNAYASDLARAFATPQEHPQLVLAEAGTGTGKTIGYLAPATLWAEKNEAPVWISTFTRNLQHQVITETARLYPDREEREQKTVALKGRENYLCLLNLEDALAALPASPRYAVALGLMARWAGASRTGDLTGPDFPAWLGDLMEEAAIADLADRRGECIHSACRHYTRCFVEKSRAIAKSADIIVANHALVMVRAAMRGYMPPSQSGEAGRDVPMRIVFDEGHHVFDAADSAFASAFTGFEAADLRRWIRGAEHGGRGRRSRAKGLERRLEDIVMDKPEARRDLDTLIEAARILPGAGWQKRISDNAPQGPVEAFLFEIRRVIYERVASPESLYGLEAGLYPLDARIASMLPGLIESLGRIARPLQSLANTLLRLLADETAGLDSQTRARIEGAAKGLIRNGKGRVAAWQQLLVDMLAQGDGDGDIGAGNGAGDPAMFVDWMEVTRRNGRDVDVGLRRHLLDPARAFGNLVLEGVAGAVITSATLTDNIIDPDTLERRRDWDFAARLTGAAHLPSPPTRSDTASPFDYAGQTRVLVVDDLSRDDTRQTAMAMAELMRAAGGGGLGLFTAIRRLRETHPILAEALQADHIPLYAQHVDAMNLQTLLQIFRMEARACLLGTDAVRDGIDVPGRALQLIIFDRVPWPRPDILFKARAAHFGREVWADRIIRMRLRQAYGRLVRRGDDRGVFVMLDSRLPSRMAGAFPEGVEIRRCGIKDAIAETGGFLQN